MVADDPENPSETCFKPLTNSFYLTATQGLIRLSSLVRLFAFLKNNIENIQSLLPLCYLVPPQAINSYGYTLSSSVPAFSESNVI